MVKIQKNISFDKEDIFLILKASKTQGTNFSSFVRSCAVIKSREIMREEKNEVFK